MQKELVSQSFVPNGEQRSAVYLEHLLQPQHMSNSDHAVRELADILDSYYKVARKRFVDNVCMQGADYHLVTGPATPLKLFSPSFVLNLNADQLQEIAGEGEAMRRKRQALSKEIRDLEAGKKIVS